MAIGIDYAVDAFAVKIEAQPGSNERAARITLSNQTGSGTLCCTLDGSKPDVHSQVYPQPLSRKMPALTRADVFADSSPNSEPEVPSPARWPRSREFDSQSLLRMSSDRLKACGNDLPLRLEDGTGEAGRYFNIDLLDPCWIYPQRDLSKIDRIEIRIGTVPTIFRSGTTPPRS